MKIARLACFAAGCVVAAACASHGVVEGSARHIVTAEGTTFAIDGRKLALWVAPYHYWRVPSRDAWRSDFARIAAAGYNAVALDFPWGYHSPRPGVFDFSGVRDAGTLLADAARANLYVIVEPGPFIAGGANAEGLPGWLLTRNTHAGRLSVRYARESRRWIATIDHIFVHRQLTTGEGPIVAYVLNERRESGALRALRRRVRADGISVPFTTLAYGEAADGIAWGWTGDPFGAYGSFAARPDAGNPKAADLQTVTAWRTHADDSEALPAFEDQAWPPVGAMLPNDADEARAARVRSAANGGAFLGVDDYGFHNGAVWYRGRFLARGTERAIRFDGLSGRAGACSIWINGAYAGGARASADGAIAATLPLPRALHSGERAVVAMLFENMGHNEGLDRSIGLAEPRGLLHASIVGSAAAIAWRILGNGEYNTDAVRGPLAAGGLGGEIAGWQQPDFADGAWPATELPATPRRAGVIWYRTRIAPAFAPSGDEEDAVIVDDAPHAHYRAEIFANGWLIGHLVAGSTARHAFPIPDGIVAGNVTLAIAAWSLDAHSGLGNVSLGTVPRPALQTTALQAAPSVQAEHGTARLLLDASVDPRDARPYFAYRGADIAPTIQVAAGDTIDIALNNRLPASPLTNDDVNLHFHGLNVAPHAPGDDVLMTLARPGETLHYSVRVPRTQPPGLYWYHPHAHGEAYWQLTSGMAGTIVVHGAAAGGAMPEHILALRDVQDVPDIMTIPWYARRKTLRSGVMPGAAQPGAAYQLDADDNPPAEPCLPENGLHVTVNGAVEPAIGIAPGQQQLFRVVNASGSRVFDLAVDNERIGIVAIDGYPIASYPGNPRIVWTGHVVVPPGGRVEFIATGQAGPTLLRSRCYDSGAGGDRDPEAVLARLEPAAVAKGGASASTSRPLPLTAPSVRRTVRLSEDANGFYIDGKAFEMDAPPAIVAHSGTVEEWTILNETNEVHAFHIHQVHVVAIATDGVAERQRVWRDTVLVPVRRGGPRPIPGSVRILVDFRDPRIRGTFVFHCHMADHEDGGMMATIKVI
jgi:FtsP/CotA-like multicopper oxidase with cupredoxin domain